MFIRRFALMFSVFALALLLGGIARADIADGGPKPADMTTTQAKPDLSTGSNQEDDGCSMARRSPAAASSAVFLGSALALLLVSRRRVRA